MFYVNEGVELSLVQLLEDEESKFVDLRICLAITAFVQVGVVLGLDFISQLSFEIRNENSELNVCLEKSNLQPYFNAEVLSDDNKLTLNDNDFNSEFNKVSNGSKKM